MFISDDPGAKRRTAVTGFAYLAAAIVCALFGAVYERFSHGVFSYHMIYAFAFPLCGVALPFFALALSGARRMPGKLPQLLYRFGIVALTVGSIMNGVLEIYGTTNRLVGVYTWVGIPLAAVGAMLYAVSLINKRPENKAHRPEPQI